MTIGLSAFLTINIAALHTVLMSTIKMHHISAYTTLMATKLGDFVN